MAATKGAVHPISKKNLEAHLTKVDQHMESIMKGDEICSLFDLVKGIGSGNEKLMAKEVTDTIDVLRTGFSLYYEMAAILEDKTEKITDVPESEKRSFLNSYSMFAASSFIEYKLGRLIGNAEPFPFDEKELKLNSDLTKDDALSEILFRYHGLVNFGKRNKKFEEGIDFPRGSLKFFEVAKKISLSKKPTFNPKLVELVENDSFRVADEFTINGFEASHEQKAAGKIEFAPLMPNQVAGNVLAKKEMLRDMDRIALFDLIEGKNPTIDVGGLSWSVLYDGFPGTGKSSLFKMGLTRLRQRCEQVGKYWQSKNLGNLKWSQMIIDNAVKDEYYGKTGKNLLEKLEVTKRADGIYIITTDDIDLLVSGDRNSNSGGGDKDILNILMQYSDGINTMIRGNVQWWAATNDATAMDPALRQRFVARYQVDGPQEWYDFADILHDKLKKEIKLGIVDVSLGKDYTPYQARLKETGHENPKGVIASLKSKLSNISLADIGKMFKEEKDKNERFTGRATHAVSEAIKMRINDYEIPEEWFEKPEVFLAQEYSRKVDMLKGLCKKVDGEVIVQELKRYADSELRYAREKFEGDVTRRVNQIQVELEAQKRYKDSLGDRR